MRKILTSFNFILMLFLSVVMYTQTAHAQSVSAGNAFNSLKGNTTIDSGGSIHSQARSIYSLGGGMTTFAGKKVTLLSADPPGFSAGCSGISWHFGGFAFISMDELRQLVEAVAQASLGVAIDLAMQTLCPQCYAVMSKLRDIVNAMRNAAADACKIARNMGMLLMKEFGISAPSERQTACSSSTAGDGKSEGWLNSAAGSLCRGLESINKFLKEESANVIDFLNGNLADGKRTPTDDTLNTTFNVQYQILGALGYKDGSIKDLLLNYLGMTIYYPEPTHNCSATFRHLTGLVDETGYLGQSDKDVVGTGGRTKVTDEAVKAARVSSSNSKESKPTCYAPPRIEGVASMGKILVCGFRPYDDAKSFANIHLAGNLEALKNTAIGKMCNIEKLHSGSGSHKIFAQEAADPMLYTCRKGSADCLQPKEARFSEIVATSNDGTNKFTGLVWYITDALMQGAAAVKDNRPLPAETIAILNGSGYPLYRLINLAAVYPGMTEELLQAYAATIAVQYTVDTLDALTRPGSIPSIDLRGMNRGLSHEEVSRTRSDLLNMFTLESTEFRDRTLKQLSQKRALVEHIVQINRALQADVVSQGLVGNADLAVSLKKQLGE